MNIKEIIDTERWDHETIEWTEHNASLDRIEIAVGKRMDVFEKSEESFKELVKRVLDIHTREMRTIFEQIDRICQLEDALKEADQLIGNEEEDERQFHKDVQVLIHNKKEEILK